MAYIAITDKSLTSSKIKSKNYPKTSLKNIDNLTTITDIRNSVENLIQKDYAKLEIRPDNREAIILELLPFRVRFQNIGLNIANANVPGIGLQVIGVNNYIL
jgi:hypothetical protein